MGKLLYSIDVSNLIYNALCPDKKKYSFKWIKFINNLFSNSMENAFLILQAAL